MEAIPIAIETPVAGSPVSVPSRPVSSSTVVLVSSQSPVMRRKTCQNDEAQRPVSRSRRPARGRTDVVRARRWKTGASVTWRL